MLSTTTARAWLDRWDRQQEYHIADRDERAEVIADVVAQVTGRPDPAIVDLGCGPGSLATRLLDRLPGASVVGVDADPLLLGLARAAHGDRDGLRFVEADLRAPGWVEALDLHAPVDAVVSTTALHWLTRPELDAVYREVAALIGPGGVFVDGDHQDVGDPRWAAVERAVREGRAARVHAATGVTPSEDWAAWWEAVGADPDLAGLVGARGARPIDHHVDDLPTLADHVASLRAAGFTAAGTVWQHGDDRVLVALR
jgi:SAM-dependent methyltransferase